MGSWYLDCWVGLPENRFDGLHTRASGGSKYYIYIFSGGKGRGGWRVSLRPARSVAEAFSLGSRLFGDRDPAEVTKLGLAEQSYHTASPSTTRSLKMHENLAFIGEKDI